MTQQQGIVKGDAQQKLGSAGFIIGASLMIIGGLLLPPSLGLVGVERLKEAGEHAVLLQASALLATIGYWAILIGTMGVYRSITASGAATSGAAWARLGFYFHVMGVTLWTVGMSLDVSLAAVGLDWIAAPAAGKEAVYSVYAMLPGFGRGIFPMNVLLNWLAFAFIGIGMVRSAVYPRWLGWVELILGIAMLPIGVIMTFTGREALLNLFIPLSMLTILWFLVIGIWVARKAW